MASLIVPTSSGGKRDPNRLLSSAISRATAAGADPGVEQGGSFLDQAKRVGGGGLLTALDWLGRPGQAVLRGVQAQQTGSNILRGIGRGFTGSTDGWRWRSEDTTNLRGALNTDNWMADRGYVNEDAETAAERQGGRLVGAIDLVGSAVLDPTSYLTMGGGAVAKTAAKGATEQLAKQGSDELAQTVAQNAGKRALKDVLSPDELKTVREAILKSDEAAIAKGGAEKFADNALKKLNKPAGVRFAGQQILDAETLRPAAEATRLVGKTDEAGETIQRGLNNVVGDSRIVEGVSKAVKPRYEIARQFGTDVADQIGRLGRRASADEALNTTEAVNRINTAAKAANVTEDELRTVFTPARDRNELTQLADNFATQGDQARATLAREINNMPKSTATARIFDNAAEATAQAAKATDDAARNIAEAGTARNDALREKAAANTAVSRARQELRAAQQQVLSLGGFGRVSRSILRGRTVTIAREEAQNLLKEAQKNLKDAEKAAEKANKNFGKAAEKADKVSAQAAESVAKAAAKTAETDRVAVELTPRGRRTVLDRAGRLSKELDIPVEEVKRIATTGSLPRGITREEFEKAAQTVARSTKDMVEKNTLKSAALSTQRAYADQARDNLYRGLADVKDANGQPLFSETARNGFEAVELSDGTKVYVPSEIKKEFSRINAIITNDESMRAFERAIDGWQKWWRASATVPLVGGFGFHLRNAQGNVFNNFLAGVKDPTLYFKTAPKLQIAIEKATRSKEPFADAIRKQGLTDREIRIVEEARNRGTIGDFLVQADQEIDPLVRSADRGKRIARALDPRNRRENFLIRSGTYVGRQVETNARLAHFIDVVNKTGSFEQADESVRKFLFDYADLTPIEQKTFRRYVPFYTYLRKNTPLQFEQLFLQPGKYTAIAKMYNEASLQASDTENQDIPRYLLEQGAIPITDGDSPMMLSVDTPFSAAIRAVTPGVNAIGMIGGEKNPLRPEGGKEETARSIVNQVGGGPAELAKFVISEATGKDLFTGANIENEGTGATLNRLAKAISPVYGKAAGITKDAKSDEKGDKISRVVDAISGANATALTDKRSEGETYRKLEIASKAIAAAKADGADVPSTSELQKAGVLPRTPKKPKAVKKAKVRKQKTPKQKAQAKLKKAKTVKPRKPPTP